MSNTYLFQCFSQSKPNGAVTYPLNGSQKLAIMRNVEKMLVETLRDPDEVGPLLSNLTLGRYHDLTPSKKEDNTE